MVFNFHVNNSTPIFMTKFLVVYGLYVTWIHKYNKSKAMLYSSPNYNSKMTESCPCHLCMCHVKGVKCSY